MNTLGMNVNIFNDNDVLKFLKKSPEQIMIKSLSEEFERN